MFSRTCEYAIRAVLFIAQKSQHGEKVGVKIIAKNIDSPAHFIAKILQELSRKGLILSAKGPNGGFYMDKKCLQNSIADIVKAVDGDKIFSGCAIGLKTCSESKPCPIHNEFKKIREHIFTMLHDARIGEFNDQLEKKLVYLKRG